MSRRDGLGAGWFACTQQTLCLKTANKNGSCGVQICMAGFICMIAFGAIYSPETCGAGPAGGREARPDLIYHNYCSVCHGDRGDGRSRARNSLVPPPKDFTSEQTRKDLTRDDMIVAVTNGTKKDGRPTAMVSWTTQLTPQEITAVVDYVRTTFMQPGAPSVTTPKDVSGTSAYGAGRPDTAKPYHPKQATGQRTDMLQALPKQLVGNIVRGRQFYMANCVACHGEKGDGAGPRAYFINPRPRNFLAADARAMLNRPALYAGIADGKPGTEMPAWNKVLRDQQIADVAEFVFWEFIRNEAAGEIRSKAQ
jgi:mono/diheme cytochrome c family protein